MGHLSQDVLSYGKDREPRWRGWRQWPRWRRLTVAAACVAVVLAAALAWYLPGSPRHGGHAGPGVAAPGVAAPGTAALGVGSRGAVPGMLPTRPALMSGQSLPSGTRLRLLLGGQSPAWLVVPSGQAQPIGGLPGHGSSYQFTRVGGGWAAQGFPQYTAGCGNCAPSPLPVYYVADGSATASLVGNANVAAPAAASGALWLERYRRGANMSTASATAQEVSVTGAALGPRLRLPAGYVIDGGTRAGLLLVQEQPSSGPAMYELWDPGTRRVTRSFVNVIAVDPTQIAWIRGCAATCRVRVLDLTSGRAEGISLPGLSATSEGAFSPDGRLLALLVTSGVTADGHPAVNELVVATIASGRIADVPGATVGSGIGVDFGWQPGDVLIADVAAAQGQPEWQIGVWQPGDARLLTGLALAHSQSWPVIGQGPY